MRDIKSYLQITLKGMAMGAADVVPGVSGGTIAFITGIYEELIQTINQVNLQAFKVLFKEGIGPFWKHINGWFLVSLLSGIGISIFSLAKIISGLLESQPVIIWSFFFGLVLASIPFVAKNITKWSASTVVGFLGGALIAYWITILPASEESADLPFIFFSGMIAICAMILPGISGSFILLLMGVYPIVLGAIKDFNVSIIAVFAAGAVVGLLSFARLLKWMFAHYHNITISVLAGFLLGSLNKIWPWKQTLEVFIKHPSEEKEKVVSLIEKSVLPQDYAQPIIENGEVIGQASQDPQTMTALGFVFIGILLIAALEWMGRKKPE